MLCYSRGKELQSKLEDGGQCPEIKAKTLRPHDGPPKSPSRKRNKMWSGLGHKYGQGAKILGKRESGVSFCVGFCSYF